MDDIRVWCDLILTDEGLLSICPSILKVVEETTSVEWMEEVGKAVGLNSSSVLRIPENENYN
jgi:deoxyhypusine synthase